MDVGDDDLFAVFDEDSSKDKKVVLPEEKELECRDPRSLVKEICGSKRPAEDVKEETEVDSKKLKTDTTLMTGLSDTEVQQKIEDDGRQARGDEEVEKVGVINLNKCITQDTKFHLGEY